MGSWRFSERLIFTLHKTLRSFHCALDAHPTGIIDNDKTPKRTFEIEMQGYPENGVHADTAGLRLGWVYFDLGVPSFWGAIQSRSHPGVTSVVRRDGGEINFLE